MLKVLFIGDIFGKPGRHAVREVVPRLRREHALDLVIGNGENAAEGRGVSVRLAKELFESSVDFLTSGNHIWHSHDIYPYLNEPGCRLIRPANFPSEAPGKGWGIVETKKGGRVAVINIIGQIFMPQQADYPLQALDRVLDEVDNEADAVIVDMHAEATSEKRAMGWHADGRVQACVGTHTHVQTSDEEILPGGCAYITDLGMTGPYHSVIGQEKEAVLKRFRTTLPVKKFEVASGDVRLCGAIIEIDETAKRAVSIKRVCERIPDEVSRQWPK
ncbi:MAG: TIGR00282 family metallophosphoesterase [Deltaproteobacteria bacterium]|nr:TIGR00282 family metallophosphoesterase [Deltaproteobacteria bacterium]